MNSTAQTAQDQRSANLTALQQTLKEMFASTKSAIPTTREKPIMQGPVIVIRGK